MPRMGKRRSKKIRRVQRAAGATLLLRDVVKKPWNLIGYGTPIYEVKHETFKPYFSRELKPGDRHKVYVKPPGKEVRGGLERTPIEVEYRVLQPTEPGAEIMAAFHIYRVRRYMMWTQSYKAEVLENDVVEIWPTDKLDYFVMGLVKETCIVCGEETGDQAYGVAYMCDVCNRAVHAECVGIEGELKEEDEFKCPCCGGRPAVVKPPSPAAAEAPEPEPKKKKKTKKQPEPEPESEEDDDEGSEEGEGESDEESEGESEEEEESDEEEEEEEAKPKGKGKGKAVAGKRSKKANGTDEPKSKRQRK